MPLTLPTALDARRFFKVGRRRKNTYVLKIRPDLKSIMVEGRRRFPTLPGSTNTELPNILRQAAAVLSDTAPARLALVETSAIPA